MEDVMNQTLAEVVVNRILTASERIVECLQMRGCYHAVHELGLRGISDCAASARLRELARTRVVVSRYREGTRFKEWAIRQIEIPTGLENDIQNDCPPSL